MCSCSLEIESTFYFLLHCHHYKNICVLTFLLNVIAEIIVVLLILILGNIFNTNKSFANLLLFGSRKYTEVDNSLVVSATIKYLLDFARFNDPLL